MNSCSYEIRGAVVVQASFLPLPSLRVELHTWIELDGLHSSVGNTLIETAITDKACKFAITFHRASLKQHFGYQPIELFFRVYRGDELIVDTRDTVRWKAEQPEEVVIEVDVPTGMEKYYCPPEFDADQALDLKRVATLTPQQIREEKNCSPDLFDRLSSRALNDVRDHLHCHLESASDEARAAMDEILEDREEFAILGRQHLPIAGYIEMRLERVEAPEEARREIGRVLRKMDLPETVAVHLQLDTPVARNPLFQEDLQRASSREIGLISELDEKLIEHLEATDTKLEMISPAALQGLVEEGTLDEEQAANLGLNVNLYQWTEGSLDLMRLVKEKVRTPDDRPIRSLRDLAVAAPTRAALAAVLENHSDTDQRPDELVERLIQRLEVLFPHAMFKATQERPRAHDLAISIEQIQPFLGGNPRLFSTRGATVDFEGIGDWDRAGIESALAYLKPVANRYPGLRLPELLHGRERSPSEKAEEITRRVNLMDRFYALNPDAPFLSLDYTPGSDDLEALDFGELSEVDREMVLETSRAQSRLWQVAQNPEDTNRLLEAGYRSAADVVEDAEETFIANTGLSAEKARAHRREAQDITRVATARLGMYLDETFGGFSDIEVNNISAEIPASLRRLPGYAEFVGSQDYCNCRHCQSILSPAAYFVDLMTYIEKSILEVNFIGAHADSALHLFRRRPDLWESLVLNCECTDKTIPYLTIINEVLENYVFKHLSASGTPLPSRAEIEDRVYRHLSEHGHAEPNVISSFQQPFSLPLERLRIYLSHFSITRAELVSVVQLFTEGESELLPQALLDLSGSEYALIVEAPDVPTITTFLRRLYGFDAADSPITIPNSGRLTAFDAKRLLKPMGVSRSELTALLNSRFVSPHENVEIRGEKKRSDSVQNDIERIHGLNREILDRLHRFTRLWKHLPWSIRELDLLLSFLSTESGRLPLPELARLLEIQKRFRVSVEELCTLFAEIPDRSAAAGQLSLFDRLFNREPFARSDPWEEAANLSQDFRHPAFHTTEPPEIDLRNQQRLLAGLNVDDETLLALLAEDQLGGALGIGGDGRFMLTNARLSLVYRHIRLASLLSVSVAQLFQILRLAESVPGNRIEGIPDLVALITFYDLWQNSGHTLDDLAFLTGHTPVEVDNYPSADEILDEVRQRTRDDKALLFSDTVLAEINGVTEEQSRRIIARNTLGFFIPDSILTDTVTITIPDTVIDALGLGEAARRADLEALVTEIRTWLSTHQRPAVTSIPDAALADMHGLTAAHSREIMEGHPGIFHPYPIRKADTNRYRLAAAADLTMLTAPSAIVAALREHLEAYQEPGAPEFSDAVFSGIDGLTDSASREIFDNNSSLFEEAAGEPLYTLTPGFSAAGAIEIPEGVPLAAEVARSHLSRYHVGAVVPMLLGGQFGLSADKVSALYRLTGREFSDGDPARLWTRFLWDGSSFRVSLQTQITQLHRLTILFGDAVFTVKALDFVRSRAGEQRQDVIPIRDRFRQLSVAEIRTIGRLRQFLSAAEIDQEQIDDSLEGYLEKLVEALEGFESTGRPPRFTETEEVQDALAGVLGADRGLVRTLNRTIPLPQPPASHPDQNRALEALVKIQECVRLSQFLGAGGEVLSLIASGDYGALDRAATALYAAFRTQYKDEDEWQKRVEPFEDKIREQKRDALSDFITHRVNPDQFRNTNDLYHWFLVDTELEGCARTSKVVAGISSLQLYVQRCLMNLERSRNLLVRVSADAISEWEWRKNYRVWEANRKVFLWPENYIEPELRDNKTPLFEELESTLLQQEIDAQSVREAYSTYLAGFDELARLRIAGAYHDRRGNHDVLHLFGVTSSQPPLYYYRSVENVYRSEQSASVGIVWHPWEKMDLQIPVSKVSPILFKGQLHVFWVEIATRPRNEQVNGTSRFTGYSHTILIKFSRRRLDATWSTPQRLDVGDYGTIQDNLVSEEDREYLINASNWAELPREETVDAFLQELFETAKRNPARLDEDREYDLRLSVDVREDQSDPNSRLIAVEQLVRVNHRWPLIRNVFEPTYDPGTAHLEPRDDYSLKGSAWDQVYPNVFTGSIFLTGLQFQHTFAPNLYRQQAGVPLDTTLFGGRIRFFERPGRRLHYKNLEIAEGFVQTVSWQRSFADAVMQLDTYAPVGSDKIITNLPSRTEVILVNGALSDGIIDANGDVFYLHSVPYRFGGWIYELRRLGTTLSDRMAQQVFEKGVSSLLDFRTQKSLGEAELPFTDLFSTSTHARISWTRGTPDFTGSLGVYFREIFFHVPFLIANHLNSEGKFAAAQEWYHYIFDPTAPPDPAPDPTPWLVTHNFDRVDRPEWRYLEFRNHEPETLHQRFQDQEAVERYARDPFNPYAIARVRLGAFKKTVLMKYIDNLLDWGDHLFARNTMESINEATMLYVMAADLLGARPAELGDCKEEGAEEGEKRTYEVIKDKMADCAARLETIENASGRRRGTWPADYGPESGERSNMVDFKVLARLAEPLSPNEGLEFAGGINGNSSEPVAEFAVHGPREAATFGTSLRRQACVFCIPQNKDLLAYWDRVEDRLHKIRNCLNISGIRRELSLFAPEIDPRLLVRARAAGLSLEDVLAAGSGKVPPYRFAFLIAKAKEYAGALQAYGGALLGALEKKDAEDLARLRLVHQENVLKATSRLRDMEVAAAEASLEALSRRQQTVTDRRDYYEGLISDGLSEWEEAQMALRIVSHSLKIPTTILSAVEGGAAIPPGVLGMSFSSPSYSLKNSSAAWANFFNFLSELSTIAADMTGVEAGYHRREQGWEFSRDQADNELREIEKQLVAAEIRRDISERSREIHETTISQVDEIYEFYREKFTNEGLYTYLATTMQRLFRGAYQDALTMDRLAERAFRFERGDDTTPLLDGSYWEAGKAGLLAGEKLMAGLRDMETRYMEAHDRNMEVDQAFSLTQIDAAALITLKQTGECTFDIPELYFDLFYPGHYRRRIKSARLTIPCVTGPYTNVSATLTLTGSRIRKAPELATVLLEVPPTRSTSIATSTAQNDAGVFRLDFRDERYMPFEGAGAISAWRIQLPKSFRPFDYATINDIILHISYTADHDESLRVSVESATQETERRLRTVLTDTRIPRGISLRQEFSSVFNMLLSSSNERPVSFEIATKHFPIFLMGNSLVSSGAKLILRLAPGISATDFSNFTMSFGGASMGAFVSDPDFGGLPSANLASLPLPASSSAPSIVSLFVDHPGGLASNPSAPPGSPRVDPDKLLDVILFFEYGIA